MYPLVTFSGNPGNQLQMNNLTGIQKAAAILKNARYAIAFTGAGVSAESGIPPFRGEGGIWQKYKPEVLEISYFLNHPAESWPAILDIFYAFFGQAKPNAAHHTLADWENSGLVKIIITQNIDNLHQLAGSMNVVDFHGNSGKLVCTGCSEMFPAAVIHEMPVPPVCPACNSLLKPDFVFFGEGIPAGAIEQSFAAAGRCDVCLIIGTTGEVMPAAQIPVMAKRAGATLIEINTAPSQFTRHLTDCFIKMPAGEALPMIDRAINQSAG